MLADLERKEARVRITHSLTDDLITHHARGRMYFILIVLDPFKPRSSRAWFCPSLPSFSSAARLMLADLERKEARGRLAEITHSESTVDLITHYWMCSLL